MTARRRASGLLTSLTGFCSAHWFDYHPSGIVAVGYYGGGLQLLDARDPQELKPYGHATWGLSEVWDAYWVPRYNKRDVATEDRTNIVYTVDLPDRPSARCRTAPRYRRCPCRRCCRR